MKWLRSSWNLSNFRGKNTFFFFLFFLVWVNEFRTSVHLFDVLILYVDIIFKMGQAFLDMITIVFKQFRNYLNCLHKIKPFYHINMLNMLNWSCKIWHFLLYLVLNKPFIILIMVKFAFLRRIKIKIIILTFYCVCMYIA